MRVVVLVTIFSQTATIASALTFRSQEPTEKIKSKISSKLARDDFDGRPVSWSKGLLHTRAKTDGSCGKRDPELQEALAECAKRAKGAMEEAQNPSSLYYKQFFKDDTPEARKDVVDLFGRIADECGAGGGGKHIITCIGGKKCEGSAVGWGEVGGNSVKLCDAAFVTKEWCGGVATWDVILHEFTHNMVETKDLTYDVQSTLQLPGKQSRINASSFNFFAQAVALGCDYGKEAGGSDNPGPGVPDPNDNAIPGSSDGKRPPQSNPPQSNPPARPAPGNAGSGVPGPNDNAIPGSSGGKRPPQSKPPQSNPAAKPAPGAAGPGIDKVQLANDVGKVVGENVVIESVDRIG